MSKGLAFVERWEAEEGKVWSESAAEEAAVCSHAADIDVDAPVEELDITPLINVPVPEEVWDGAQEDEALPGIVL